MTSFYFTHEGHSAGPLPAVGPLQLAGVEPGHPAHADVAASFDTPTPSSVTRSTRVTVFLMTSAAARPETPAVRSAKTPHPPAGPEAPMGIFDRRLRLLLHQHRHPMEPHAVDESGHTAATNSIGTITRRRIFHMAETSRRLLILGIVTQ